MDLNKFFLSKTALEDIKNIYVYSLEQWGKVQAEKYVEAIYADFKLLADNKKLGKNKYDLPFLLYPSGRHCIVYVIHNAEIVIITVINQLRDIEGFLNEFGKEFEKEINLSTK